MPDLKPIFDAPNIEIARTLAESQFAAAQEEINALDYGDSATVFVSDVIIENLGQAWYDSYRSLCAVMGTLNR